MESQTVAFGLVVFIIFIALVFDYVNGFHDAANSIATIVSTRVLSPGVAVAWAAFFNFIAFVVFGTAVAKTIGGDLVKIALIPADDRLYVLLAGLVGAIVWNLITWYLGLPSSIRTLFSAVTVVPPSLPTSDISGLTEFRGF